MGAELGATSSIFPSDGRTRAYLKAEGREADWKELSADPGAEYDETDEIDLSSLEPLIACPSSPGNVVPVRQVAGKKVHQVIVGSSANGSFRDLMVVAEILRGRVAHPGTALHINPASRELLVNVEAKGGVMLLLKAGASIHQSGCLGCIGMGQAPGTGEISLRTFPRNFPGRSGTKGDQVYLCSSETAAAAALTGSITDPRELGKEMEYPRIADPEEYLVDTSSIIFPPGAGVSTEIVRGPNIKPFPELGPLPERLETEVLLKTEDNVTTDHIMPAGNQVLPLRSNIEAISEYVYYGVKPEFASRAKEKGAVAVIGGENYGQGSSREHAALAPRYLGVRAKVVKSYARIHKANLCNFGILPFTFKEAADYEGIEEGALLVFPDLRRHIEEGDTELPALVNGREIPLLLEVSPRQRKMLLAGGEVNVVRGRAGRG